MPHRGPFARLLLGIGLLAAAALAVLGGLALPPSGLVAIGLAGVVAGALAGGIARESARPQRSATVDAAWKAAVGTVTVLLVLSGTTALGGAMLTLLVAAAGVAAVLAAWSVRTGRTPSVRPVPQPPAGPLPPVSTMGNGDLGREWVHSTEALAGRLDARTRHAIVVRRQETLDELERRDPAGFARWLSGVPLPGSDPAGHLRHGDPAA
ncbi:MULTISPECIES: hypothetical protein [unclassified Geodermatophilus]|uniref:hypothetical protein n=1 Tax=unclassified Geodermatophilus TaxID=2637632 RepID=UPI003EE91156